MTRIMTNLSSLMAQQSLANNVSNLQTAMTRLSTGLQINSGADNPSGLIASQALQSNITSIGQAVTNSQTAQQMISTADGAMGQVSTLLNTIRGLVTASANTGALSADQISANQLQVDSALQAINQISQTTSFQGQKLLDGSLDFTTTAGVGDTAANVKNLQINNAIASAANPLAVNVNITSKATQASITGTIPVAAAATKATATMNFAAGSLGLTAVTAGAAASGVNIVIGESAGVTAGSATATYTAGAGGVGGTINVTVNNTATTTTAAIGAAIATTGQFTVSSSAGVWTHATDLPGTFATSAGGAAATTGITGPLVFQLTGDQGSQVFNFSTGTSGTQIRDAINLQTTSTGISAAFVGTTLTLTSADYGSQGTIGVQTVTDANGFDASLSNHNVAGTDIAGNINGYVANGAGNTLSINTPSLSMSTTVAAGSNTSFAFNVTGGGALFQLGPDVQTNEQMQLGIQSVSSGTLGNGNDGMLYTLGSGQTNSLASNPAQASKIINDAISQVANLRGRLGAFEAETVNSNVASLQSTLTNLTAANSSIVNTDYAAETATMTQSQILEQAGISVLSTANQQPQMVLKLLQ